MAITDGYRNQHDELVAIVQEISGKLEETSLAGDAANEVSELLKSLAGKLLVHLAAEDKVLYPKMIDSGNSEAADAAKKFQEEMGGLKSAFEDYYGKWVNPRSIAGQPSEFITQTKDVLSALAQRVEKENTVLYPLVDRL